MKKVLSAIICLAMVLSLTVFAFPAYAATEGDFTYEVVDGKAAITDYTGAGGAVTIPSTLGGYPVTSIGDSAFSYLENITSIIIPDSVTEIREYAFLSCLWLVSVTVPDSVTYVGRGAFDNTDFYRDEANWVNGVMYVGKALYSADMSISGKYTVKDGTACICHHAFEYCDRLTSIVIPDSVTSIDASAFYGTGISSIYIYNANCDIASDVYIPTTATIYGYRGSTAEAYASAKRNSFVAIEVSSLAIQSLPTKTSYLVGEDFSADGLSVTAYYTDGRTETAVADVSLPDMTTEGTKTVTVSYGGKTVAFEITVSYTAEELFEYSLFGDISILTGYTGTDNDISIPPTLGGYPVARIGYRAFYSCAGLTSIIIPDSVSGIDSYAFFFCSDLESVRIPDSVTSIGAYAFSDCGRLTSIVIPGSVTSISEQAFGNCIELTSLTIENGVTSIGKNAFHSCTALASIAIPDSVTYISGNAFGNTAYYNNSANWVDGELYIGRNLYRVSGEISGAFTVKDGTAGISGEAFMGCSEITAVTIPDSVTSIGEMAFYYCLSLASIVIPDSVTFIGNYSFHDTAYYNDSANWEDGVLYIGKNLYAAIPDISGAYTIKDGTVSVCANAFNERTALTSITIPDSVISIGDFAFSGCIGLTSIVFPDSVTSIGDSALSMCALLDSVYIFNASCAINLESQIPTETTVYGFADSTAEGYASEHDNPFVAIELSSISVSAVPTKTSYVLGEEFSSAGLAVTANYTNGITAIVTVSLSAPDMTTVGTKTVTVTYEDKTTTFDITVNEPQAVAGDVNGDGEATTADARLVLIYSLGDISVIAEEYIEAADYNGDGGVTTSDARLVLIAALV